MAVISEAEKLRRQGAIESVVGTNAMEGIVLDAATLALMSRFEEGAIEIEELSAAIDLQVRQMLPAQPPAAVSSNPATVDAA